MKRTDRFFVYMLLCIITVTFMYVKPTLVRASNIDGVITVSTPKALLKEIKKKKSSTILFESDNNSTLTIKLCNNSNNKKLIINAPNMKIINKSKFKTITVLGGRIYSERISGNKIKIEDNDILFSIYKNVTVKKLIVSGNIQIKKGKNASVKKYSVKKNTEKKDDVSNNMKDFDALISRISQDVWNSKRRYKDVTLDEPVKNNQDGYYLSDVDYLDHTSSNWPALSHLEYIIAYIKNIGSDKIRKCSDETYNYINGLIDYWISNDFYNDNWYYNKIALPYEFTDIAIMFKEFLSSDQLQKIKMIIDRGTIGRGISKDDIIPSSNDTDYLLISIRNAIIFNDDLLMKDCIRIVNELIDFGSSYRNGIQADYSYFDYSMLASGGSYGRIYSDNISYFLSLVHGTNYQVNENKEKLFIDFLLDGQYYFHYKEGTPHFSLARSSVLANGGETFKKCVERLIIYDDIYRVDELKNYYNSFEDSSFFKSEIKDFDYSATIVSVSPKIYLAVRGCNNKYSMTNVQNNEGVLNYNLSYGSNTCYMKYGNEYSSIGEVFDFSMFPGTTTYYESDDELEFRYKQGYNRSWGHIDFVKNIESNCVFITDSTYDVGILSSELHNGDISGKNCFIIYKDSIFVLGTDFSAQNEDGKTIVTTVNQCLADDEHQYNGKVLMNESYVNNGIKYTNLCKTEMITEKKMQSGSYYRTNRNASEEVKSKNVFRCYYNWGCEKGSFSYAYVVSDEDSAIGIKNIINDEKCQLIEFDDGLIAGIAYGEYTYNNGIIEKTFLENTLIIDSIDTSNRVNIDSID